VVLQGTRQDGDRLHRVEGCEVVAVIRANFHAHDPGSIERRLSRGTLFRLISIDATRSPPQFDNWILILSA
jgi:hypothetical protein